MLRIDPRLSLVFSPATKRRFVAAAVGSVMLALLEVAGILAVLPLMLLLTGSDMATGPLHTISSILGVSSQSQLATWIAGTVFLCFTLKAAAGIAFRWWMFGFVNHQQIDTSVRIMRFYLRMPYVRHIERGTPELIRTMNDAVGQFYQAVVTGTLSAATEAVSIVLIVAGLFVGAPYATMLLLIYFVAAAGGVQLLTRNGMRQVGDRSLQLSVRSYRTTFQALNGIKEIKLRNNLDRFVREYRESRIAAIENQRRGNLLSELPKHVLEVIFIIGIALATVVLFTTNQATTGLGVLAMFVAAGFRLLPSATRMLASLNSARMGMPAAELVLSEVAEADTMERSLKRKPTDSEPLDFTTSLQLERVHFRYPTSERDVIDGVTLEIPKGASIGLVGSSGAGKSTLVDIILGLHEPSSGVIRADGVDVHTRLAAWQQKLAMVPQEVYLTDGSLRENIAFGLESHAIDPNRIETAVEHAQLQSLIDDLPEGLDTPVGERGGRLSGGQRQRIGIARALYHAPELLVMDEATSALDNVTERKITETIQSLRGQVTIIVVAHRLSTVRQCDRIVFMKRGQVEAVGTFEEVQRLSPDFAHLVELGSLTPEPESSAS